MRISPLPGSVLLIASTVFYGASNRNHLALLFLSILVNFVLGRSIAKSQPGSRGAISLFGLGITLNLGLLAYFKYSHFFADIAASLSGKIFQVSEIALPLAISFYTFTQIVFLKDCLERRENPYQLPEYALFVLTFPHLVAGPIVHHHQLIPQLRDPDFNRMNISNLQLGMTLLVLGLSKKVMIADTLAPLTAACFSIPNESLRLASSDAWLGNVAYSLQIYFDFSGYSEMAVGLGLLFNLRLPINFIAPYQARNFSDFWRRWHISLSLFFRDFVYRPLGGNQNGAFGNASALMATMFLSGLWHGAGWGFVLWGILHGVFLISQRVLRFNHCALTFLCVTLAWVPFRAKNLSSAFGYWASEFGLNSSASASIDLPYPRWVCWTLVSLLVVFTTQFRSQIRASRINLAAHFTPDPGPEAARWGGWEWNPNWKWGCLLAFLTIIDLILMLDGPKSFIYYQF